MNIQNFFQNVDEASAWIKGRVSITPRVAVVLSGGLESFALEDGIEITSEDIPYFPKANAEGHAGRLVFGKYKDVPIVVLKGRYHYYEGHMIETLVFPYFVLAKLGVRTLIATNAAGGINESFKAGDIMMISDHINLMGTNPLIGIATQKDKDQFTSLTNAYDENLRKLAKRVAGRFKLEIREGVYLATSGPSYETKAEIRAFRLLGADAVGMSIVPEVIAANFLGMRVLVFSCIANLAADLHKGEMSHSEVLRAMKTMGPKILKLLGGVIEGM